MRTNNDVEGWHRKLKAQAQHGYLPFYQLVDLLYRESRIVDVQVLLVAEHKLRRNQRLTYKDVQGRLHDLWDEYDRHKNAGQLL